MNTKTTRISHIQRDIFWAGIVMLFILVVFYIGFLSYSIRNVSIRQNVNDRIVLLRSKVAQLEFQYVSMQNNITNQTALSQGYVALMPVAYVSKESRLSLARP